MTKPQTIKEIVEELNTNYMQVWAKGVEPNIHIEDWLRTKLQSLKDEKAEILREVRDKLNEDFQLIWTEKNSLEQKLKMAKMLSNFVDIAQKYGVDISK